MFDRLNEDAETTWGSGEYENNDTGLTVESLKRAKQLLEENEVAKPFYAYYYCPTVLIPTYRGIHAGVMIWALPVPEGKQEVTYGEEEGTTVESLIKRAEEAGEDDWS